MKRLHLFSVDQMLDVVRVVNLQLEKVNTLKLMKLQDFSCRTVLDGATVKLEADIVLPLDHLSD